jgi:SAM-dependent methyltransferase
MDEIGILPGDDTTGSATDATNTKAPRPRLLACPLCRARARRRWATSGFCQCPSCGLLFRKPRLENLDKVYASKWEHPADHTDFTGATDPEIAGVYCQQIIRSLERKDLRGLRILDFGAGRGTVLRALREAGAEAVGIEPYGHDFLRARGFAVYSGISELPHGSRFDGVIAIDVVEHLQDPGKELAELKGLLGAGGWIYCSTPNAGGLKAAVLQEGWSQANNPSHLFLFNPPSLELLLRNSGYRHIRRLMWFVDYGGYPAASAVQRILQILRLDGELRYLAQA